MVISCNKCLFPHESCCNSCLPPKEPGLSGEPGCDLHGLPGVLSGFRASQSRLLQRLLGLPVLPGYRQLSVFLTEGTTFLQKSPCLILFKLQDFLCGFVFSECPTRRSITDSCEFVSVTESSVKLFF